MILFNPKYSSDATNVRITNLGEGLYLGVKLILLRDKNLTTLRKSVGVTLRSAKVWSTCDTQGSDTGHRVGRLEI